MLGAMAVKLIVLVDQSPDQVRSISGPFGPIGVWQLPQPIGPCTRYSPRSTLGSAIAVPTQRPKAAAA